MVVNKKRYSGTINALVLMGITFLIFPFLATFKFLGTNSLSTMTHFCVFTSFSAFFIGYELGGKVLITRNKDFFNSSTEPRYGFILIISIGFLVIALTFISKAKNIIESSTWTNDMDFLRANSSQIFSSSRIATLFECVMSPILWVIFIICLVAMTQGIKRMWFPMIINLLTIGIVSFCFAARANVVRYLFYTIFVFFLNLNIKEGWHRLKVFFNQYKILSFIFTIGVIFTVLFMTLKRNTSSGLGLFDNIYMYYISPFKVYDYYWNNPEFSLMHSNEFWFGGALFGSIVNLVAIACVLFFGGKYWGTDYLVTRITAIPVSIGGGIYMNAATTAMYPFYRDAKYVGLIVGFFIWGWLIKNFEGYSRHNSLRTRSIYVFLMYVVFKLNMTYEGLTPTLSIALLMIIILTRKKAAD